MVQTKYYSETVWFSPIRNRQLTINEVKIYRSLGKKSEFADTIRFPSRHEYRVYSVLRNSHLFSEIIPQYKVEIIPPKQLLCFPNGKNWKVDFCVRYQDKPLMLVEAKGIVTKEFPAILAMLEHYNRELFERLWLVFANKIPQTHLIKNLQKHKRAPRICTFRQFQAQLK